MATDIVGKTFREGDTVAYILNGEDHVAQVEKGAEGLMANGLLVGEISLHTHLPLIIKTGHLKRAVIFEELK